jgi:hypothetical protein
MASSSLELLRSFYRTVTANAVFLVTMLLRTTLLTATLALLSAAPAAAQAPVGPPPALAPLKPCYVAAQDDQREYIDIVGSNFTPFKAVDIFIDSIPAEPNGAQPTTDYIGGLVGSVKAPFIPEGQRTFQLRVSEQELTTNAVTVTSKVTRLSVVQSPPSATTNEAVRFRGRGFTDLTRTVFMHYVFAGKSKKTIQLDKPTGDCGLFSVKRRQFPFKKSPQVGVWTIQFDQELIYNPKASPRVPLTIKVRKAPKVKPKGSARTR